MAYHAKKPKTDRPKTPTEKASAAGAKMDDDDDEDEDDAKAGGVTYSKKEPYHARLKQLLNDGSFDPATVQLRDFLKVHKDYKQFKRNSLRAAFNLSDVGYVAKAMEHDNGTTIPTRKVHLYVGVLEKALWDLRDKKKSGMIIDFAKIPLQEQVNVAKKMTTKLVGAADNTTAMLIVLQTLSSEEVVSDEEVHTDLLKVYSPLNSKKRASCS
jgi:hypothetical protein